MTPTGPNDPAKTAAPPGTAVATRATPPKPALAATGGQAMAIIPKSVEEMFRLAEAIYSSGLAPQSMSTREKVMVAIMAGAELGMPPWQSTQSFAVIGNRPSIWGDAIPALLWSNGFKLREWFENEAVNYPDNMTAHCVVIRPDGTEIEATFSVADAKEANLWTKSGPWQTAKKRMLKMRARGFAARDGASDVLRGMKIAEEVGDYVTHGENAVDLPPRQSVRDRLRAAQHQGETSGFSQEHVAQELDETPHDPETGEVIDAEFTDQPPPGMQHDCEVCGAKSGEECKPECRSWDDLETVPEHIQRARAQAAPQSQGSTATASSESTSEHAQTSTSDASTTTSGGASQSATATTDDFPGDRKPAETPKTGMSTAEAASAYEARLNGAANTTKLQSIRNANAKLLERIDQVDPDRYVELEALFNRLYVKLEDQERAEAARK